MTDRNYRVTVVFKVLAADHADAEDEIRAMLADSRYQHNITVKSVKADKFTDTTRSR